jgi:hypothetical protein
MNVNRKYLVSFPNLNEFEELGSHLIRSYLKINELYPFKQEVSFELCNGSLWYSRHGKVEGAMMGDFLSLDNSHGLTSLAMELQALSYTD